MEQRVSLITLGVSDVAASRALYERLGWKCANDSDAQGVAFSAQRLGVTAVIVMQCLVFADGGVLSLGANVFNMGLVGCVVGFCCYRLLCGSAPSPTRRVAAVAFAGWCATIAGAVSCAGQLSLSGAVRLPVVLPALVGVQALIGVGEAVVSSLVVASVLRFRPELLENRGALRAPAPAAAVYAGLGLSLAVAALLAPLAYSAPDGFSRVMQTLGLRASAASPLLAPFSGYGIPGVVPGVLASVLAGCLGSLLLFGLCWLLALALVPRSPRSSEPSRVAVESSG